MQDSITAAEKLEQLRQQMTQEGLDGYIVPRADEYQGEFVASYAERLQWLTGFTGSAGTALILKDRAAVMTDARYTIQIRGELDRSLFEAADITETGIAAWLKDHAGDGAVIGYDPMLHTARQIETLKDKLGEDITLRACSGNLVDKIWNDQPAPPAGTVFPFPEKLAGQSARDKIKALQDTLTDKKLDAYLIDAPDAVSWLLNVRGSDVPYMPYVLSRLLVRAESAPVWYAASGNVSKDIRKAFEGLLEIKDIAALKDDLKAAVNAETVGFDENSCPAAYANLLGKAGRPCGDLCMLPKACKTDAEQKAIKEAHVADGVALVKFLYWLETKALTEGVSEVSAAEKLAAFRGEHAAYLGPSFPAISGYGANGAIVHYRASARTDQPLQDGGLYLFDSGGQYLDAEIAGTTDLTRTVAIGNPPEEAKANYTNVLKGHIDLARARFPAGTTGAQLDTFARAPLWQDGHDFAHGTGHGVGVFLCVHEDSASLSPRGKDALKPGMLLSNEPGYYKEGAFGIRIENLVLVQEGRACPDTEKTMLYFETVSLAPIDLKPVDFDRLDAHHLAWINGYHADVFKKLSPHLDGIHTSWLAEKTAPIYRN